MKDQPGSTSALPTPLGDRQIAPIWVAVAIGSALLGLGIIGFWLAIQPLRQGDILFGGTYLVMGILCAGACVGVIWWGKTARPKVRKPNPWLNRRDWAKGEIASVQNASSALALGCVGALAGGGALFLILSPSAAQVEIGFKCVCALFGIAFSAGAIYTAFFRRKFGKSFFRPSSVPGVIGGTLEGTIDVSVRFAVQPPIQVQLQCLRLARQSDISRYQVPRAQVLWGCSWTAAGSITELPRGTSIGVKFHIPHGLPESGSARVSWQLNAKSDLPGLDYVADFEVPVFCVAEGDQPVKFGRSDRG